MKNTTIRMSSLSTTTLLFCLLLFSVLSSAHDSHHWPGFIYTRTTGTCTPQFWSGRKERWPRMVAETSTVSNVFGWRGYERYRSDLTLLEATARKDEEDNPFGGLLKEGAAALINSYARKGFPYKPWQVKTLVIKAICFQGCCCFSSQTFLFG